MANIFNRKFALVNKFFLDQENPNYIVAESNDIERLNTLKKELEQENWNYLEVVVGLK